MTSGPTGGMVYRIVWLPGSDVLRGYCWCGSPREADDPVELWQWLLDHPHRHGSGDAGQAGPAPVPARPAAGTGDRQLTGTPT